MPPIVREFVPFLSQAQQVERYLLVIANLGLRTSSCFADPWKDESGKGR